MNLKSISSILICLFMITAHLPAQDFLDPCDETEEMAHIYPPHGIAYDEGFTTSQLVATVIIGTLAVGAVVALLWDNPGNCHAHHHCKRDHHRCNHSHHHFCH